MVRTVGQSGDTHGLLYDGSSARHQSHAQPPPRPARSTLQPPGGATNFVISDGSASYGHHNGGGYDDAAAALPGRRHTNGLKRLADPGSPQAPRASQPPGGRSQFTLTDGSAGLPPPPPLPQRPADPHSRGAMLPPPQEDALSALVDSYSKPASRDLYRGNPAPPSDLFSQPAPPQHFAGHMAAPSEQLFGPPAGAPPPPPPKNELDQLHALGDRKFGRPRAPFKPVAENERQGPGNSVNVQAPPGGFSSFALGWGDDSSCNHHHHYRGAQRHLPAPALACPPPSHPSPSGSRWTRGAVPPGGASSIQFG